MEGGRGLREVRYLSKVAAIICNSYRYKYVYDKYGNLFIPSGIEN